MTTEHMITISAGRMRQIRGMLPTYTNAEIVKMLKMPLSIIAKIREETDAANSQVPPFIR